MNVLFNQFHDILCGCSIKEAYDDAAMSHGESLAIAQRSTEFALQQIAWNIDTLGEYEPRVTKKGGVSWINTDGLGTPLVVFNPLAHETEATVQIIVKPDAVRDTDGTVVPHQIVRASRSNSKDKYDTLIKVSLPAYGYKVLRLCYNGETAEASNPFICTDNSVDNGIIRMTFDTNTGELASATDIDSGRELMSGASLTFLVDETHCDTWAHDITEFRDVTDVCTEGAVRLIESGPVRATVRCEQKLSNSTVIRDYSIIAGSDVITVNTRVDFHEKHRMLKFSIPVNVKKGQALCEIPFGKIERPCDGTEQVCGKWFLMREGERGLCVANDSKYSFDAKENVLTLTVLRGAIFADHFAGEYRDEFCPYMDQGEHEFVYTIFPYKSLSDTVRRAAELNCKPEAVAETFHKGTLPERFCGISVDADNVQITAIKEGEDGGTVIRLYEIEGRDTDVNITLFGKTFSLHISHNSVVTAIIGDDGEIKITNFLE